MIASCDTMRDEIILPTTDPETEWILGSPVQKVSPFRTHALLQLAFGAALAGWAKGRGEAGSEWRFRVAPPGETRRPLVPDLAYVAKERLAALSDADLEAPPLAPDIAVEILSPSDVPSHVAHKIAVYLAAGSTLAIVIDPQARTVRLHDSCAVRTLHGDDVVAHEAMPGFELPLPQLFAVLDRSR